MSTLAVNTITNAAGGNTAQINGMTPTADSLQGFRNRIINGDMRITQRGTAAVTATAAFPVDRFTVTNSTDGAFSAQQDSSAPVGFVNSLKYTTTTADGTLTGVQRFACVQRIEGTNIADLAWGTANATPVTLSFWVRSSLTGTFGGALQNNDQSRSYPFTYSISAANTWEQKAVTIAGDTTGTWLTTTGVGIRLEFGLGVGPDRSGTAGAWNSNNNTSATGAVSVIGTLNATWFITGVQLEAGSVATPFERRDYGRELMLCQRYYLRNTNDGTFATFGVAVASSSTVADRCYIPFPTTMRAAPTMNFSSLRLYDGSAAPAVTSVSANSSTSFAGGVVLVGSAGGLTGGRAVMIIDGASGSGWMDFSAEL
jgi:hypothetical protein